MTNQLFCSRIPIDIHATRVPDSNSVSVPISELRQYGTPGKILQVFAEHGARSIETKRFREIHAEVRLTIESEGEHVEAYLQAVVSCEPLQENELDVGDELTAVREKLAADILEASNILSADNSSELLNDNRASTGGLDLARRLLVSCGKEMRSTKLSIETPEGKARNFVIPATTAVKEFIQIKVLGLVVGHKKSPGLVDLQNENGHLYSLTIEPKMLRPLLKAALEDKWVVVETMCERGFQGTRNRRGYLVRVISVNANDRAPATPSDPML